MDPASNQKLLATTTAMLRLGPDWQYRTQLAGPAPDADGEIPGDVVLRGSGDPTLRPSDLSAMAQDLVRLGVRLIAGGVVGDPRRLGSNEPDDGLRPAIEVERSLLSLVVRPGGSVGAPASVTVRPWSETFVLRNRAATRPGRRNRLVFSVSITGGRLVLDVAGGIGVGNRGVRIRRRVPSAALYAATVLAAAMAEAGIEVKLPPRVAVPPARSGDEALAVHRSAPLAVICRRVNKDSDNELAERVLETVGAEAAGGAASPGKGLRVLREALGEMGTPPSAFLPANGSGLGHTNRISAQAVSELVRSLSSDPRIGPDMLQSLSVGGIDGTTRNRFRGSPSSKRVRAKTGTLRGVSCLSGLVGDAGDTVAFSILVDGVRHRALNPVRFAQVAAVNAITRYLHEAGGAISDLPVETEPPALDVESGSESEEGEARERAQPTGEGEVEDVDPGALDRLLDANRTTKP